MINALEDFTTATALESPVQAQNSQLAKIPKAKGIHLLDRETS